MNKNQGDTLADAVRRMNFAFTAMTPAVKRVIAALTIFSNKYGEPAPHPLHVEFPLLYPRDYRR